MPEYITVEDAADPRLVELRNLTDATARRATDAAHGCFIVEGIVALDTAVRTSWPIRKVLVAEGRLDRVRPLVADLDTTVYVTSNPVVRELVGFPFHRGVFAVGERRPLPSVTEIAADASTVLVVEGVTDHENVGSLFRNAAAFGVEAVLVDPATADPLYRRSVRVSLGHVLRVPWTQVSVPDGLAELRRLGFTTVALTPAGDEIVGPTADGERLAWLVGAEGTGLTDATLGAADRRVRIPMADDVDSLNVATSAAVALALSRTSLP